MKLRQEAQIVEENNDIKKPSNPNKPYYDFRKCKNLIKSNFFIEILEKMKEIEEKETSNNYLAIRNAETENLEKEKDAIEYDMLQMAKGMK